jgi:hypothetical protein
LRVGLFIFFFSCEILDSRRGQADGNRGSRHGSVPGRYAKGGGYGWVVGMGGTMQTNTREKPYGGRNATTTRARARARACVEHGHAEMTGTWDGKDNERGKGLIFFCISWETCGCPGAGNSKKKRKRSKTRASRASAHIYVETHTHTHNTHLNTHTLDTIRCSDRSTVWTCKLWSRT